MSKPRSKDSLLTKLEDMKVDDELFVDKANGYVSDCIHTVKLRYKTRVYKQLSVYTHIKPEFTSLKDFKKIICIIRKK
ncbi:MAG: hypothetical protein IKO49_03725 [Bacilli bacterium]|nr:hypothetical protein [Clostridia bacterium]MBR4618395.1 hypothetical protein [Bacilli bacterium]